MKKKVKLLIQILGMGLSELIVDIDVGDITFNSIEWCEDDNKIILHVFENDFDFEFDFDDLEKGKQKIIYNHLSFIWN